MSEQHSAEKDAGRCTAFPLDMVCQASNPCPVHGCDDTNDGSTAQGCYCDPERVIPPDDDPQVGPILRTLRNRVIPPEGGAS